MVKEDDGYDPAKHVGRHPETGIPLKRSKHEWKKPKSQRTTPQNKPLNPWFCPVKDPITGEVCGNMLTIWNELAYNQFGMCEKCAKKYNPHLFREEMQEFVNTDGELLFEPKPV